MTATPAPQSADSRRALETELSHMAALVETQLQSAVAAFERRDVGAAERVVRGDARVDAFDGDINARIVSLLAVGGFSTGQLREILTILKMTGELERVGDLAKNIARRTIVIAREAPARPTLGVARLGRASLLQLSDILNAYGARNLEAARAVWGCDDELDELYNSVFEEISRAMMEDAKNVAACVHLGFIAKNFERVGDHATNIAETIHFLVTGEPMTQPRPKGDETASMSVTAPAPPGRSGDD